MAHALGIRRSELLARPREVVAAPRFSALLSRRLNHEPVAYILGEWEFFSLNFVCRAPVLVPRPETEHLVEVALEHLAGRTASRVLDLCTGTGCVAISIARNLSGAQVEAVDLQPHAVALARENSGLLGAGVTVHHGDLFEALPAGTGPFDVIASNPPYISESEYRELSPVILKHEDPVALLAGSDGLAVVRRIFEEAGRWLAPGGLLAMEIGDTQSEAVMRLGRETGWGEVSMRADLAGHPRIAVARLG